LISDKSGRRGSDSSATKPIIHVVLGKPCGFTDEELHFIIKYGIEYRMARVVG